MIDPEIFTALEAEEETFIALSDEAEKEAEVLAEIEQGTPKE